MLHMIGLALGAIIFIGLAVACLPYALGAAAIGIAIWLTFSYWKIAIPVWIGLVALGFYAHNENKKKVKEWKEKNSTPKQLWEVDAAIDYITQSMIVDSNEKNNYKFISGGENKIPYGRVNAFLNFFNLSINDTEVFYYSAIPSKDNKELREYGTLITRNGIHISYQLDSKDHDGIYKSENIYIPFAGVVKTEKNKDSIKISIIKDECEVEEDIKILNANTTLTQDSLCMMLSSIVDTGLSKTLYDKNIINNDSESCDEKDDADKYLAREQNISDAKRVADLSGIAGANVNFNETYSETKGFMNGERGHGYAGEYVNNTFDRLMQKDVINAGQQLDEHGRQFKHGADRIVNGEAIQTKYYKTAKESIGAAFQHKQAIYLNSDGSMMPIEVPRDQYSEALTIMQKRIDSGQVPNAEPGTPAQNFVKKGWFTYSQTCNVCKAGTLESLSVDITSGIISSSCVGSISGLMVFAACIWNGKNIKEAAQISLGATLKTMGKSVLIYTLTMQLSRDQFANLFVKKSTKDGIAAGFEGIANPVARLSNSLAKQISQSALAKTSVGEGLGLRAVTGRAIISGTIIGVVVFGPDLVRTMRGRISKMQLLKNSAVGASSLAGAAVGQALIPIPVLGAMVGAVVSGFVSKKTLDNFIDDDAVAMFQIFKEEFLECTMCMALSKHEFDAVVEKTICNEKLQTILQDMYQSGLERQFAYEFIDATVCEVLKNRKHVSIKMVDEGYLAYGEEALQAA